MKNSQKKSLEEYTHEIVCLVKERLQHNKWYRGICLDTVKNSYENNLDISKAAEIAEIDTEYWDCPGWW